ncbi:MAG TPA: MFS transporter [Stellaceae bacterium]|nr:MFS transporter [Stellaceae bacterium]
MQAPSRQTIVPLIVACSLFMQNLDSTVIATALPPIAASLHEDPLRLNLAITSYLLSLAIFIPLSGWTADRFGTRTLFRAAILMFTLGSILCGLAQNLPELVVARIAQGLGGAMMVPVGRLVLLRTVPKSDLIRAMSRLALPALIGPVMGPPLGGLIVTYASWRWIFFINVPFGLLGVVLVSRFIDEFREPAVSPLDLRGFVLLGAGLAAVMFGLETAGRGMLAPQTAAMLLAGGAVLVALYAFHARAVASPIIDLALMRIPTFSAAILGSGIYRVGIEGLPFLIPLLLQLGFGLSPLQSGILTFATYAGAMTMKASATPIIRTLGFRHVLVGNVVISALFMASYSLFRPTTPHLAIFAALLAGGFFRSLQVTSTNSLVFADVPPALMSRATSFASMAQQFWMTLAVGVSALLLNLVHVMRGGGALAAADFAPVFLINAVLSVMAIAVFVRLAPEAGAELSGHRAARLSSPGRPAE